MNLIHKTNEELLTALTTLRDQEVRSQIDILWHLHEVQRREMDLERGHSSLYEFALTELGFSKDQAYARIRACEILALYPEIEEDLLALRLCQTSLMLAQVTFRGEDLFRKKAKLSKLTNEEKIAVIDRLRKGSVGDVKRILIECFPHLRQDIEETRPLKDGRTQIKFSASPELMAKFNRLKDIWAHTNFERKWEPFFERMVDLALAKCDVKSDVKRDVKAEPGSERQAKSRPEPQEKAEQTQFPVGLNRRPHVQITVKRRLQNEAQYRCQYVDPANGRRCSCTHGLEIDHIKPLALGGESTIDNMRIYCRAHNQHAAKKMGLRRPTNMSSMQRESPK